MGEIFDRVCSLPILLDAWKPIKAKGASGGLDGVSVDRFQEDLGANLEALVRDLRAGRYSPEPLERVHVPKHDGSGETRPLSLPSIRDKVLQQAVRIVVEPLFNPRFLDCSYAYRPGKGPRKAFGRINHFLTAEKKRWVAVADFDRFFDSLDQEILTREFAAVVGDPEVIALIRMWMKIGYVGRKGDYADMDAGVGQGSVISPLLSNIYAHPLDAHMTAQGYAYLRYSDNMIVLALTREEAERGLTVLTDFSGTALKLVLNAIPRPVRSLSEGFAFLGIFYQHDRRVISTGKMAKISARLKALLHPSKKPEDLMRKLVQSLEGTGRYYGAIEPEAQFTEIDGFVAERLAWVLADYGRRGMFRNTTELMTYLAPLPLLSEGYALRREESLRGIATLALERMVAEKAKSDAATPRPEPVKAAVKRADRAVAARKRRYIRDTAGVGELVVSTHGAFLGKASGRVVVRVKNKILASAQLDKLKTVLVGAKGVSLSSDLIRECIDRRIAIHFAESQGPPYAMVHAPAHPRATLSMAQLKATQDGRGFEIARSIVRGKVRNQVNLLKFYGRSRKDEPAYQSALDAAEREVGKLLEEAEGIAEEKDPALSRERLMSVEGRAASAYWGIVKGLVAEAAAFPGRRRQGAADLVNGLLNYGYAMLYPRVWRAVVLAGLNPHLSFLHAPSDEKPSLAFDLIEEFRCQAVDRAVITMLIRKEPLSLDPKTALLTEETKRLLIANVLERLASLVPSREGRMPLDEVIRRQARRLASALEEDKAYRPFVGRW